MVSFLNDFLICALGVRVAQLLWIFKENFFQTCDLKHVSVFLPPAWCIAVKTGVFARIRRQKHDL